MVTILILTPNGSGSLGNHATSLVCFSSGEELVKHEKTKQNTMLLRALGSPGLLWERVQVGGRLTRWGFPPAPALSQSVATLTRGPYTAESSLGHPQDGVWRESTREEAQPSPPDSPGDLLASYPGLCLRLYWRRGRSAFVFLVFLELGIPLPKPPESPVELVPGLCAALHRHSQMPKRGENTEFPSRCSEDPYKHRRFDNEKSFINETITVCALGERDIPSW